MGPVLVTGGAGFIGSHLVARLMKMGVAVRVLDDFSSGKQENLQAVENAIEIVRGDLADLQTVRAVMAGRRHVFHLGAMTSVPQSVDDPLLTHQSNVTGTFNILTAAKEVGVQRVVYASSSAVYNDQAPPPHHEGMIPKPSSPYGVSKLIGEHYCALFTQLYGLETVSLRYFNVYGPRQDETSPYASVIPKFVKALLTGQRPVIYGDGYQTRDFIFVDDIVTACLTAATRPGIAGDFMNVGCGTQNDLWDLLGRLKTILGSDTEPILAPPAPGDMRHNYAGTAKAERLLNIRPQVGFADGLKETVRWYSAYLRSQA